MTPFYQTGEQADRRRPACGRLRSCWTGGSPGEGSGFSEPVVRFRLDFDVQLLDTLVHLSGHPVDEGNLEVEARPGLLHEFPQSLHDGNRPLLHREECGQQDGEAATTVIADPIAMETGTRHGVERPRAFAGIVRELLLAFGLRGAIVALRCAGGSGTSGRPTPTDDESRKTSQHAVRPLPEDLLERRPA
jgi:hypothetical protein